MRGHTAVPTFLQVKPLVIRSAAALTCLARRFTRRLEMLEHPPMTCTTSDSPFTTGLSTPAEMIDIVAETKTIPSSQQPLEVTDSTVELSDYAEGKWRAWSTGKKALYPSIVTPLTYMQVFGAWLIQFCAVGIVMEFMFYPSDSH